MPYTGEYCDSALLKISMHNDDPPPTALRPASSLHSLLPTLLLVTEPLFPSPHRRYVIKPWAGIVSQVNQIMKPKKRKKSGTANDSQRRRQQQWHYLVEDSASPSRATTVQSIAFTVATREQSLLPPYPSIALPTSNATKKNDSIAPWIGV